jgi:hypothetical protein
VTPAPSLVCTVRVGEVDEDVCVVEVVDAVVEIVGDGLDTTIDVVVEVVATDF